MTTSTAQDSTVDGEARRAAQRWLAAFEAALSAGDPSGAALLFEPEGVCRDLAALTWNLRTFEGRDALGGMLAHASRHAKPHGFHLTDEPSEAAGVIEAWLRFETETATCVGHLRIRGGKAWTFLAAVDQLKGHEEAIGSRRQPGAEHGARTNRTNWADRRRAASQAMGTSEQPYVLVIGGGQAGLSLAARLKQLGVSVLVIDKRPRPGDTWRSRYASLCLHDPVWYDHMPYMEFPRNWPVFTPKDKMGDFLEAYADFMEIDYWGNTVARSARYDEQRKEWTVQVEREGRNVELRPSQLVFATGLSGFPNTPRYPGADEFLGDQHHSSAHAGPEAWRGKKAVVIGSNNSAHDICAALWEEGAQVTMVQRSSTLVIRSETLFDLFVKDLYSEEALSKGITVERADLVQASLPYRVLAEMSKPLVEMAKERDAEFYRRLAATGFKLDFGVDGSGLWMKYMRRGSGYYIDVGASELIIDGRIGLKQGQVERIKPRSVVMDDGTELEADLIVYATGYGPMSQLSAQILPAEMVERVGRVWGLGSDTPKDPGPWEGEARNMWRPTQQEGLWFHGGNLYQCRFFSKILALQLKARMEGLVTPVYGLQQVHHKH